MAFAALVAAIVSSLASMLNSTSTIFTMDIYKRHIAPQASERQLVKVGRIVAFCALLIAMAAVKPLLGGLDQAFQYIQEYSGYVYPGSPSYSAWGCCGRRQRTEPHSGPRS